MDVPEPGSAPRRPGTALEVWWGGRRWMVPPERSFVISRDEGVDLQIIDLNSPNGTFVNGQRVARAAIGPQDVVGISHALLHLDGDRLIEHIDTGEVSFRAEGLVVRTPAGKQLLDRVGFALKQRSLLAVVGPSGAGKSILLRALTGFRPADEGRVQYADRDLYRDYDELRQRIGLVPQDDILHPQLTVHRALTYAARLRFPSDVVPTERERRMAEVVGELGLTEQTNQRITSLSGGGSAVLRPTRLRRPVPAAGTGARHRLGRAFHRSGPRVP